MRDVKSVGLPKLDDGRSYITAEMATEHPHLRAFIERFPEFWVADPMRDIWVSPA